jgi:hypothetical protein
MMTAEERERGNYQLLAYNEHHISHVTHTVICQSSEGGPGVYIYHHEVDIQSDNYRTFQKNEVAFKVVEGTLA